MTPAEWAEAHPGEWPVPLDVIYADNTADRRRFERLRDEAEMRDAMRLTARWDRLAAMVGESRSVPGEKTLEALVGRVRRAAAARGAR